ncbi:hypothetical protein PBCVAP110A_936L [Paramecium bursaria Chlorella virus AP110A]|nr:hypothetical protein PBCVAP110A_936L [Paramecium bursaria Chlorella virus AP110A]
MAEVTIETLSKDEIVEHPRETLAYYSPKAHKIREEFSKYTVDTIGVIRNKDTGMEMSYSIAEGYYRITVYNDKGKRRTLKVHRAIASTFLGSPPSKEHTPDHKDRDTSNNALTNLRWASLPEQRANQDRPETLNTAFVIVKDGVEKTANEWAAHKNVTGRTIKKYAQKKQHGYAYKEYPDLEGEEWVPIWGEGWGDVTGSTEKPKDHWEISNMKRMKYVTSHAENVLSGDRLGRGMGYPRVGINGKKWGCHVLAFRAFHPELWKARRPGDIVLHKDDDKEDFRPHKLRLGTRSDNAKDAHDNGKHDGKKTARMRCASFVDGVHEENHDSQTDAAKYIKAKTKSKASVKSMKCKISMALSGDLKIVYGRTWIKI